MKEPKPPLFRWREDLMSDPKLRPALKHLALTMSTYMDIGGRSCFPSGKTLAEKTSMNIGSVHRLRAELEDLGWIVCVKRGGSLRGEHRERSEYEIPDHYRKPRAQDAGSR